MEKHNLLVMLLRARTCSMISPPGSQRHGRRQRVSGATRDVAVGTQSPAKEGAAGGGAGRSGRGVMEGTAWAEVSAK
jgi:hypothetical protein